MKGVEKEQLPSFPARGDPGLWAHPAIPSALSYSGIPFCSSSSNLCFCLTFVDLCPHLPGALRYPSAHEQVARGRTQTSMRSQQALMNLAGSCSPKDVESQLFSPGKTTWQKSHAVCWKDPYFLAVVQLYKFILSCSGITALGDLGYNTDVLFPNLFLFPFLLPLGEADGHGWHYCSSRCIHPYWAWMASPGASEKQPQTGEKQKARKTNLEVYCCNAEAEQAVLGTALACP